MPRTSHPLGALTAILLCLLTAFQLLTTGCGGDNGQGPGVQPDPKILPTTKAVSEPPHRFGVLPTVLSATWPRPAASLRGLTKVNPCRHQGIDKRGASCIQY